jgi:opacity protein-like surface antigen
MKFRNLLLISASVASLMTVTNTAEAASAYVSIFGGASFLQQPGLKGVSHTHTTTSLALVSHQSLDTSFKTGFVVGGNWGIDWGNFRTELEAAYHGNKSGKRGRVTTSYQYGAIGSPPSTTVSSKNDVESTNVNLRAYSLMANAWYDFHDFGDSFGGITPYIGGGIGMAQVQIDGNVGGIKLIEKNDFVFAWQVGAGASYPLSNDISLFADYRYFSADGAHLYLRPGFHGGDINADFDSHEVLVGFRFKA